MIGSDVIRGYCDTILLSLLAQGDSYGYELSRAIRERSGGAYVMKETTLYSAFARLEKRGFIASYQGQESRGAPHLLHHHRPRPGVPPGEAGGVAGNKGADGPFCTKNQGGIKQWRKYRTLWRICF